MATGGPKLMAAVPEAFRARAAQPLKEIALGGAVGQECADEPTRRRLGDVR
jgi:hypothetical protein